MDEKMLAIVYLKVLAVLSPYSTEKGTFTTIHVADSKGYYLVKAVKQGVNVSVGDVLPFRVNSFKGQVNLQLAYDLIGG